MVSHTAKTLENKGFLLTATEAAGLKTDLHHHLAAEFQQSRSFLFAKFRLFQSGNLGSSAIFAVENILFGLFSLGT